MSARKSPIVVMDDLELVWENATRLQGARLNDDEYNRLVNAGNTCERLLARIREGIDPDTLDLYERVARELGNVVAKIENALKERTA